MVHLPSWTPLVFIIVAAVHLSGFFVCDTQLVGTSDSPISFIDALRGHFQFTGCGQTTQWFDWLMFFIGTLPLLLLLYVLIAPLIAGLLSNSIAGTIAGVAGLAALIIFFGALIVT